jgi:YD repeat-containing protein
MYSAPARRLPKKKDLIFRFMNPLSQTNTLRVNPKCDPTPERVTIAVYECVVLLHKIESTGRTILSIYDPITLMKTEGIEGEGMTKTRLNVFGTPTQIALYLSDKNSILYSKVDYTYDGLNRLVSRKDQLNRTTEYRTDQFDRVVETIWPDKRVIKTQYASQTTAVLPTSMKVNDKSIGTQSFDGLGRVTNKVVGMRTTTQSYQEAAPEPAQITNNKGVSLHLKYEPALDHVLISATSASSGVDDDEYHYDPQTAAPLQFRSSYSTRDLQYLASGQLSRENIQINDGPTLSAYYVFSMAGKLQKYTDVNGVIHEIRYDGHGRIQSLVQGKLKVTFTYDTASRVTKSCAEDEEKKSKITTSLAYDDFGREIKRSVYKGETVLSYHLSQIYNETGLVASRYQEDASGAVWKDEHFEYDAYNRLINYECRGNEPPVDQNGNAIRSQHFSFDNYDNISQSSTTFQDGSQNTTANTFSAQDPTQLLKVTNTHPDYPSTVDLSYDENGCLTQDEQGRILQYDDIGRLIAVRDHSNDILAEYLYDAVGKLVCQKVPNQPNTRLFYRDSLLIAIQKGDSQISYLSDGDDYWGEAISQGGSTDTHLWASDGQQSVLATIDSKEPDKIDNQRKNLQIHHFQFYRTQFLHLVFIFRGLFHFDWTRYILLPQIYPI